MAAVPSVQFDRKGTLLVRKDDKALDLSDLRFRFRTSQQDEPSPNNCAIRVYNLSQATVTKIQKEFDSVVLQAGYENGPFGTVFAGTIRQFGVGKEQNVNSYLDILGADGDIGYNFGVIAATLASGSSIVDVVNAAAKSMGAQVAYKSADFAAFPQYLRGKVMMGMGRDVMRDAARARDARWSFQNGSVQLIPLTGYLPGDVVELNSLTGLVGIPTLTEGGVNLRCLLNPLIRVGGRIKINNADVNRVIQANPRDLFQFNSWTNINMLAQTNADGLYIVYQAEHQGDTRGGEWYTDIIALAADSSSGKVASFG